MKNFCSVKDSIKRMKDKLESGRKHLQTTYLTKNEYLNYLKNSQNSVENSVRKWVKDMNRHFQEDAQMANKHNEDAQNQYLLEKCKLKPQ